ncbi:MAG: hypothetical protein KAI66_18505 [Lentisphaeria bacterium]|nr:hypothetical protein [Lentisphaeria bacterium]
MSISPPPFGVSAPWSYHPGVSVKVTRDDSFPDFPRLTKTFGTPAGTLRMTVKKIPDYPWDDPPLFCDHNWSLAALFGTREDMDDIANAVRKVCEHRNEL